MCHHFIGIHTYDQLPKHRPVWRCSACGRESQAPIDCCVQPAFAVTPQLGIGHAVRQWLRAMVTQAVTGLAAIRQQRSSTADFCATEIPVRHIDIEADERLLREGDSENAELEETTHAAV